MGASSNCSHDKDFKMIHWEEKYRADWVTEAAGKGCMSHSSSLTIWGACQLVRQTLRSRHTVIIGLQLIGLTLQTWLKSKALGNNLNRNSLYRYFVTELRRSESQNYRKMCTFGLGFTLYSIFASTVKYGANKKKTNKNNSSNTGQLQQQKNTLRRLWEVCWKFLKREKLSQIL